MLTNPSPAYQPMVQPTMSSATPSMITPSVSTMMAPAAPTMAQATVPPVIPPEQQWRTKFPSLASGILSSVQAFIAIVIIGCEVGSMLIDIFTTTIYVGLWAGLFFMIAWICQASSGKSLSIDR